MNENRVKKVGHFQGKIRIFQIFRKILMQKYAIFEKINDKDYFSEKMVILKTFFEKKNFGQK